MRAEADLRAFSVDASRANRWWQTPFRSPDRLKTNKHGQRLNMRLNGNNIVRIAFLNSNNLIGVDLSIGFS